MTRSYLEPLQVTGGTLASYGASAVARTSDRGRVVEVKPFFIEVYGALNPLSQVV